MTAANTLGETPQASMVLYCLLRRKAKEDPVPRFLMVEKRGHPTFPPTKFRPGEDLYRALVRPMEEDLGLPAGSWAEGEPLHCHFARWLKCPSAGEESVPVCPG